MHPARRLWSSLEPLHDVVYFAPAVRDSGKAVGLRGFWMTYFAYRSAPMGPVDAGPVLATFAGFEPSMVTRALPAAWSLATPEACLSARVEVSAAALREVGVSESACATAVEALAPVLAAADPTGRPLYAANVALPLPEDPVAALWQVSTTLREHRGDGHVAALVAAGVSGLEALLLQVGLGKFPAEVLQSVRGWSAEAWAGAADGLRSRGLLDGDALSPAGQALLADVEDRTDSASWHGALAPLGEDGVDRLVEALRPSVVALWSSGVLPDISPTGLPPQRA